MKFVLCLFLTLAVTQFASGSNDSDDSDDDSSDSREEMVRTWRPTWERALKTDKSSEEMDRFQEPQGARYRTRMSPRRAYSREGLQDRFETPQRYEPSRRVPPRRADSRKVQNLNKKGMKRLSRFRKMVIPLENEIAKLERRVESLSNPVHIHLYGGKERSRQTDRWQVGDDGLKQESESDESNDSAEKRARYRQGDAGNSDSADSMEGIDLEDSSEESRKKKTQIHVHINMASRSSDSSEEHGHGAPHHGEEFARAALDMTAYRPNEYIHAKCLMGLVESQNIRGIVYLRQKPGQLVEVKTRIHFYTPYPHRRERRGKTYHGFHVHEHGDLERGCSSFGGHYNPEGHTHGGPGTHHKHVGDWGNIEFDSRGVANHTFSQDAFLYGPKSIIGRGIVVHKGEDDHGKQDTHSSRTTGSAGARIGCCVIVHAADDGVW